MGHNPGSEAGVYNLKQVVRPRGYCGCQCAQRASHRAHAQLLTLTPLRISFMIFKRLSLFLIFLTCQERITDRTSIHVSGSRFASDAKSQRYLRLLLGKNFRCPVMGCVSHSPPCSPCSCHTHHPSEPEQCWPDCVLLPGFTQVFLPHPQVPEFSSMFLPQRPFLTPWPKTTSYDHITLFDSLQSTTDIFLVFTYLWPESPPQAECKFHESKSLV